MGTAPEPLRSRVRKDVGPGSDAAVRVCDVVIVDDHDLVRLALHTLIDPETDLAIIGEAASLSAARSLLDRVTPDVLLLDVHLPDGDGLDLCQAAVDRGVKTLVLTAYDGEELLVEAMRAGASGYVLKQDPAESVLVALRTVGAGGAHFSTAATPQMLAMIAGGGTPEDPLAHLTDRERSLLELLGEGLSNRQIAERLFLGERTIKNYVSRLLRKLDLDRRAEAAVFAARLEAQREMRRYSVGTR
jgi:two-component system, NarL family, response regulator DevR